MRTSRAMREADGRVVGDHHQRAPVSPATASIRSTIDRAVSLSRLPVGSSASSSAGRLAIAPRDGDALAFAAGQQRRAVPGALGEPDLVEQGFRAPDARRRVALDAEHRQLDILGRGQGRQQVKRLEHHADPARPETRQAAAAIDLAALEQHAPGRADRGPP